MSNAKPMGSIRRAMAYMNQDGGNNSMGLAPFSMPERVTPAQRRRINHKANKALGTAGNGTVKPRQTKTRQRRPAPMPGGLLALLSPKQIRKAVSARSANRGIKFKVKGHRPDVMIIDDPVRYPIGKGDR